MPSHLTKQASREGGSNPATGLAEPVSALPGYLIRQSVYGPVASGVVMGDVAGIMVFLSLDKLLPTAREYGRGHLAIYSLVAGMTVMAVSQRLLG
jgi:ZIP family zinc transporter